MTTISRLVNRLDYCVPFVLVNELRGPCVGYFYFQQAKRSSKAPTSSDGRIGSILLCTVREPWLPR